MAAFVDFALVGLPVEGSLVDGTLGALVSLGGLPVEKLLVDFNWQFNRYYGSISRFCFGRSSSRRIIGRFCSLLNFNISIELVDLIDCTLGALIALGGLPV